MYVDSRGPEQVVCDKYFGELSGGIKSATRRARFQPFHHPQACDVRTIPLMAFRTIAVDRDRIKMGTVLYIPSLRGRTFWNNGEIFTHDGYVIASDTGGAIEGNHIDTVRRRRQCETVSGPRPLEPSLRSKPIL